MIVYDCASAGVFWNDFVIAQTLRINPMEARPDAMILCDPAIPSGTFASGGSFNALPGADAFDDLLDKIGPKRREKEKHREIFDFTVLWASLII